MPDTPTADAVPGLYRITVNLRPKAVADLAAMTARHGAAKTDVIDRAIRLAALVDALVDASGVLRVVADDGSIDRIHLL